MEEMTDDIEDPMDWIPSAAVSLRKTQCICHFYLVNKQNTYTCLYEGLTNVPTNPAILSTIRKASTIAGDTASSTSSIVDYYNFFKVYSSPYSGAFNLLDTMNIPRACAEASLNLTQFNYFYGQNAHNYSIRQQANLASYTVRPTTVLA